MSQWEPKAPVGIMALLGKLAPQIGLDRLVLTPLCVVIAACAPTPAAAPYGMNVPGSASSGYSTFRARINDADAIVVARLVDAQLISGSDRFTLSSTWQVRERLKGAPPASITVRFPSDLRAWRDGPLDAEAVPLHRGQDYLLFLSAGVYSDQARVRGGTPVPGATSAGLGYFLLQGEAIQPTTDYDGPRDLRTLRQLIGSSS
jgi:hypothetical protein